MAGKCLSTVFRTGVRVCHLEEKPFPLACQFRSSVNLHMSQGPSRTTRSYQSQDQPYNTPIINHCDLMSDRLNSLTCHRSYSSSTISSKTAPGNISFAERIRSVMGMKSKARFPPHKMSLSGYGLLRSCAEFIDYETFFEEFDMPDTFNSWFLILELHVWLCMVRLASEGPEGRFVRNKLAEAMWADVQERAKNLGGTTASSRKDGLHDMNGHFRASLLAYDEGLLSDDRVLAGALWRVFFEKRDINPESLVVMVEYIRKQIKFLDDVGPEALLCSGLVQFLPLCEDVQTKNKNNPNLTSADIK